MEEATRRECAREHFGDLELGDASPTSRAVEMACAAARRPDGHVCGCLPDECVTAGAHDFLENATAKSEAMVDGIGLAVASGSRAYSYVLVSVDGSSSNVVDRAKNKGFGVVGNSTKNGRGLKVVTAYALQPDGTPLGVLDQQWWLRGVTKKDRGRRHCTTARKETRYFNQALEQCARRLEERAPDTRAWFLLDRESDRCATMDLARGTLKTDLARNHVFATREAVRSDVFERIEVSYNRRRARLLLDHETPQSECAPARFAKARSACALDGARQGAALFCNRSR
jgi:hypothetical protein